MKPDGDQLLAGVQSFLTELLDQVPDAMRSDVRAATKSLANARAEFDRLYPLLMAECEDLGTASILACKALGEVRPDIPAIRPFESLSDLRAYHAALLDRVGDHALALQERDGPEARAASAFIYNLLRTQGRKRLEWQSVFPSDRLVSDVLKSSWPRRR